MTKLAAVCLAFVAVLGVAAVQGVWSDRWKFGSEPDASAARLTGIPDRVGEWQGEEDRPLNDREIAIGEVAGYVHRSYTNRRTGSKVLVLLLCGRPGPMSNHTPDVCYAGQGWVFPRAPSREAISVASGAPAEFLVGQMQKAGSHGRILWGWNATGSWHAPAYPRYTFARYPALFKLYVSRELSQPDEALEDDPAVDFLRVFLPEVQKALFPDSQ
jgi:hypothetical protein